MRFLPVLLALAAHTAHALILPTHFASSMVLQRDAAIKLWGLDTPGANITVTYRGLLLPPAVVDGTGRFSLTLPPLPKNATPDSILLRSSLGPELELVDVLLGDVYICSGQSNMGIPVSWSLYYNDTLAQAGALGSRLRLLQVALLAEYVDAATPQDNFTASIPWSRASALTAAPMSALCYHFGAQVAAAYPDLPVGLVANAWGGVPIEVWMSPAALASCAAPPPREATPPEHQALLSALAAVEQAAMGSAASPTKPSCLYNSMMHPILSIPVTAFLWYQGEANAGDPTGYQCKQPAMVEDFRAAWALAGSAAPAVPFIFVQLSCWPTGNPANTAIAAFRYAQAQLALTQPHTGMVVTADLCDPAGAFHPIHPPDKQRVAARAFLWADAEVYGNAASPRAGPALVHAAWHAWDASWGDFHWGTGAGSYVCGSRGQFTCGGLVLTFDRAVALSPFYATPSTPASSGGVAQAAYGWALGAPSGFTMAIPSANASGVGGWEQPVVLTALAQDGLTLRLNVTYIGPGQPIGAQLRYAFADYPTAMPLVDAASGLPVAPFNVSVAPFPPRPRSGNCTFLANMDGASAGVAVPGSSTEECCAACWADDRCQAAAYDSSAPGMCWLKWGTEGSAKAGTSLCVLQVPQ